MCVCVPTDGETGPGPKAALDCLSLPGPTPSLSLTNSSRLPTGAQGRSWGKEGRFLQSEERGQRKALCPGAHRALPGNRASRLPSVSAHLLWGPPVSGIMPDLWGPASLSLTSSSLTPVAAHRKHCSSQGTDKASPCTRLHRAHAFTVHTPSPCTRASLRTWASPCTRLHCAHERHRAHAFTVHTGVTVHTSVTVLTGFTVFAPSSLKDIRVFSTSAPF